MNPINLPSGARYPFRKGSDRISTVVECQHCKGKGRKQTYIGGDGWTSELCWNCDGNGVVVRLNLEVKHK